MIGIQISIWEEYHLMVIQSLAQGSLLYIGRVIRQINIEDLRYQCGTRGVHFNFEILHQLPPEVACFNELQICTVHTVTIASLAVFANVLGSSFIIRLVGLIPQLIVRLGAFRIVRIKR
tara:strand:+ start:195 stop:551 length:357 start_codon:yes stop_codon:yes gene_type:complete